jgi:hypothetical protein
VLVLVADEYQTDQRKRLEQERDQLALVVQTYESVGQRGGGVGDAAVAVSSSDEVRRGMDRDIKPERASFTLGTDSSLSPVKLTNVVSTSTFDKPASVGTSSPLSTKKPAFIMTWEERERERQREKEATKTQRIQEEQRRLQQRLEERAEHDKRETEAVRQRDQSARVLQRSLRRRLWMQRWSKHRQMQAISTRAAILIQARVRQWQLSRAFPHVRERLKQEREQRWMSAEEALVCQCLQPAETIIATVAAADNLPPQEDDQIDGKPLPLESTETPLKEDVELLVSTWRQLRRAVRREAKTRGRSGDTDLWAVFRALDTRRDGVIDRAELRRGVRERFGLQLDRKLTRGYAPPLI